MALEGIYQQFVSGLLATSLLEFIAVLFGIVSVLYSRRENVLVYPTGIVNTSIYIYLCLTGGLFAEASVNFYYTVMSVVGFIAWRKNDCSLQITACTRKEWFISIFYFSSAWSLLYFVLEHFTNSTIAAVDACGAATAYTGMWLMTRKKIENWLWWMITNVVAIPLFFMKGYVFTSFQYVVFLILAIMGYGEWRKKLLNSQ